MADVNVGQGQEVKYLKYLPQYMYILKSVCIASLQISRFKHI